jgi:hypothetical protein
MKAVSETPEESLVVRLLLTSHEGKKIRGYQESGTADPSESKVTRTVWLTKVALDRIGTPRIIEMTIKAVDVQGSAE